MPELGWKEAIVKILTKNNKPMHYADITQQIVAEQLKKKVGATPAATANATITWSLQKDKDQSPFLRVGRGIYSIKTTQAGNTIEPPADEGTGFINAFGMYWQRQKVMWTTTPKLLGGQELGTPVDFCQQKGVYLLHDGSKVVYVGRTTDRPLGIRLKEHTSDRLNGRWDRFSWFGIFAVSPDGSLSTMPPGTFNIENLIATMEALLIEGLEPPQNRRRGDDFSAVEFPQLTDPEIQKSQSIELFNRLKDKL